MAPMISTAPEAHDFSAMLEPVFGADGLRDTAGAFGFGLGAGAGGAGLLAAGAPGRVSLDLGLGGQVGLHGLVALIGAQQSHD